MKGVSTISSRKDFSLVFKQGYRSKYNALQIICSPMDAVDDAEKLNLYAFNFKRQFGNACRRNRMRRIFKEYLRLNRARIKKGHLIVFCLYRPCSGNTYSEVAAMLDTALKKAGLTLDSDCNIVYPDGCFSCQG